MSYKLAIFDLDGTILNSLDDLADSVNYALGKGNYKLRTVDEVRSFIGDGVRKLIERSLPRGTDEETINRVLEVFIKHYKENCSNKTKPYSGTLEMLRRIGDEGCMRAVLSNKADEPVRVLCRHYFDGLLDYTAGEKEGVPRKPAPEGVYEILRYFGLEKKDCVYIGDSDVDVATAQNAGLDFIGVDWGFRDRETLVSRGAEKIAGDTEELFSLICKKQIKS